jgi:electron transport complex protein RnfB
VLVHENVQRLSVVSPLPSPAGAGKQENAMKDQTVKSDRREFIHDGLRVAGLVTLGAAGGFLIGRQGEAAETLWQLDPNKCIACDNCATHCVLDESAVKCLQFFDMCGYCDICTGYFDPNYRALDTAAENQMCPTGAIVRTFIEEKTGQKFFEYTIDATACVGCGKCVKGCALMNGSLYLQVSHDRCLNCNECAIAVSCPTQAFERLPADRPYRVKSAALELLQRKAQVPHHQDAIELLSQVYDQ